MKINLFYGPSSLIVCLQLINLSREIGRVMNTASGVDRLNQPSTLCLNVVLQITAGGPFMMLSFAKFCP
jgi:hypothetical protein